MNLAVPDVFLANLFKVICKMYDPIRMKNPNTVFLYMFGWFIDKQGKPGFYKKTMIEDCKANWQQIVTKWHPAESFEPLATCLFISASYTGAA